MPETPLAPSSPIRKVLTRLIVEGAFSGIMVNLVSGVLLVKLALELGAGAIHVGLLASFPFVGQIMQLPAVFAVSKLRKRRFVMLWGSAVYRLSLGAMIFVPWIENKAVALKMLVICVLLRELGGGWGSGPWNGLIRDLIPERLLGRLFGNRLNLFTMLGTIAALLAAVLLDLVNHDMLLPLFSAYFAVAFVMGLCSLWQLYNLPEAEIGMTATSGMLKQLIEPLQDTNFRRLIAFMLALLFSVNIAVPFFPVYMLDSLSLPVGYVTAFWALGQFMQLPFFKWWGMVSDRFSHTTSLAACLPFFVAGLLLWPFTALPEKHMFTVPLLLIIHMLMGVGLAGVTLSTAVISLKLAPKNKVTGYAATAALLANMAAAAAALSGGWLADKLDQMHLVVHIEWQSSTESGDMTAYSLHGYEFLFCLAALLVLMSTPLLGRIQEKGKAPKEVVTRLMQQKTSNMFRSVSSVSGWRHLMSYPYVLLLRKRKVPGHPIHDPVDGADKTA
ncbi:MAG: MFS transporter [Proteobacteria bacterium]|nr:MFS transporter [Pseudomonadota bacterium]